MFGFLKRKNKDVQNDLVDFDSMYVVVNELGIRGYEASHFETCKKIWKELVPEEGQADSLQGELLRQAECLRNEAQRNGNINWDDNFEWFCDFIKNTLADTKLFDENQTKVIRGALDYIKKCGQYAYDYNTGVISDAEANPMLFAYVDDDLYDYIEDAIALFAESNPQLIKYEHKDFIYR